jgi:uncharacterized protein YbaR (Trm112 family)
MHLLLTDLLTCPRCGPNHGLIVYSQQMEARRILEGALGCPNCQTQYPITGGLVHLQLAEQAASGNGADCGGNPDALRLAAMLGITQGPGFVLLVGAASEVAGEIAGMVPGLELVVAGAGAMSAAERAGVNRVQCSTAVPLRDGSMRGVVVLQDIAADKLRALIRLLGPGARLITCSKHDNAVLETAGLRVLARDANAVVALRVS